VGEKGVLSKTILLRDKNPTHTVLEESGINPQSESSPHSAIYIRDRDFRREHGEKITGKLGKRCGNRYRVWGIVHKIEVSIVINLAYINRIEEIAKTYFGDLSGITKKETKGKLYRVISYKRSRGDSLAFYIYDKRIEVKAWTHKLEKAKLIAGLVNTETIKRFYIELYVRYHERSERLVDAILEAIFRKYGKSQSIKYHMHNEKKITYLNRLNKFNYNGLEITIKSYRHRAYASLKHNDPEYHPKIEITTIFRNIRREDLLNIEDRLLPTIHLLNTIVRLAKLRLIMGDYDKAQEKIPLRGIDRQLFKILRGTTKRIRAINILGREYYDINHAILDLLKRGYKIREIGRILGYDHKAIAYRLKQLEQRGIVERIGRGKYAVKEEAKLEKPRVVKKGSLEQYVEYLKKDKTLLRKQRVEIEHKDYVEVLDFSHIRVSFINGKLWLIDPRTFNGIEVRL
jgi:DNA-binding MarR family transcriptional regulator